VSRRTAPPFHGGEPDSLALFIASRYQDALDAKLATRRSEPVAVERYHEDRNFHVARDLFGHATVSELGEAAPPLRAEHHEVRLEAADGVEQSIGHVLAAGVDVAFGA
jgi:hypothetical protein